MSSAGKQRPLNATAASLLGLLHRGPMSGWDLSETAESAIGEFWSITQSQVYRELAQLTERGLVRAGVSGARDRRPYTLTAAGRRAFAAWMSQHPGPEQVRSPLLLKLAFGEHLDPVTLAEVLSEQATAHQALLARYEQLDSTVELDRFARATLSFGLHYERAVAAWFAELPALLGIDVAPSTRGEATDGSE